MSALRNIFLLSCGLALTGLVGCKPAEEITSYTVPKPPVETEFRTDRLSGTIPTGWIKGQPTGPFPAEAAFRVTEGGQSAETTGSVLARDGGGLLGNVNRWRGQVKLGELTEDELRKEAQKIEVAGHPAYAVDLMGPESAGPRRERILGVVVSRGHETWFFRMRGPFDLVGKQKAAFETFVKSIRFHGG